MQYEPALEPWTLAQLQEIQALRQENEQLRTQLTALATELASLRERIGRSSRNSSKPPSSDGPGFKPPERRKGSGRKRGGQPAPVPIKSLKLRPFVDLSGHASTSAASGAPRCG